MGTTAAITTTATLVIMSTKSHAGVILMSASGSCLCRLQSMITILRVRQVVMMYLLIHMSMVSTQHLQQTHIIMITIKTMAMKKIYLNRTLNPMQTIATVNVHAKSSHPHITVVQGERQLSRKTMLIEEAKEDSSSNIILCR